MLRPDMSPNLLEDSLNISEIRQELCSKRALSATPEDKAYRRRVASTRRLAALRASSRSPRSTPPPVAKAISHDPKGISPVVRCHSRPRTGASTSGDSIVQMKRHLQCVRGNCIFFHEEKNTLWKQCRTIQQRDREVALYTRLVQSSVKMENILLCYGPENKYNRLQSMFVQVPFLELELYSGSLDEILVTTEVDLVVRFKWLYAITSQVLEIHKAGLIHAMITPFTVVLVKNALTGSFTPKISDWSSAVVHDTQVLRSFSRFTLTARRGPPQFPPELRPLPIAERVQTYGLPPEVMNTTEQLRQVRTGTAYDVYMLGQLFCYVLYGQTELPSTPLPLKDSEASQLCCYEIRHLIQSMMQPDPRLRCTLDLALHHPAFWPVEVKTQLMLLCVDFGGLNKCGAASPQLAIWLKTAHPWQNSVRDWLHSLHEEDANMRLIYDFTLGDLLQFFRDLTNHLHEHHTATVCNGDVRQFQTEFLFVRFTTTILTICKMFLSNKIINKAFHSFLKERNAHYDIIAFFTPIVESVISPTKLKALQTEATQEVQETTASRMSPRALSSRRISKMRERRVSLVVAGSGSDQD